MEPTQAQTAWQTDFDRLLEHALSSFYSAERALDMRRTNRHAEYDSELSHKATVKADAHTDAKRHLTQWVQAHPYPAADQTAHTVADSLKEANRLAQICEEKQQYRNGWREIMAAIEEIQARGNDARAWADTLRLQIRLGNRNKTHSAQQNYAAVAALTHFLITGQIVMEVTIIKSQHDKSAEEEQQYTNGWNDSMLAVEDVRSTSADPNLWVNRMLIKHAQTQKQTQTDDPYARGAADAMTHFLNTGQTDRHAP